MLVVVNAMIVVLRHSRVSVLLTLNGRGHARLRVGVSSAIHRSEDGRVDFDATAATQFLARIAQDRIFRGPWQICKSLSQRLSTAMAARGIEILRVVSVIPCASGVTS